MFWYKKNNSYICNVIKKKKIMKKRYFRAKVQFKGVNTNVYLRFFEKRLENENEEDYITNILMSYFTCDVSEIKVIEEVEYKIYKESILRLDFC